MVYGNIRLKLVKTCINKDKNYNIFTIKDLSLYVL